MVYGFVSKRKNGQVHAPVLVIRGDHDEMIPFSHGQAVFKTGTKCFWQVRGATRNDRLDQTGSEYLPRLREFYSCLGQ